MPTITISYRNEEELCQLLTMTLERLPACENLPLGAGLVRALRQSSSGLPNVSTIVQDGQPTGLQDGSPTSQTPTSGDQFITIDDPDNPEGAKILVRVGQLRPSGPFSTFQNEVVVVEDDDGKPVRRRKIPLDLKLVEALKEGRGDNPLGNLVAGLSSVVARLINAPEPTISASLARSGNTTINAVHLGLLLPVLKAFPGPISDGVARFLKETADIDLLEGNIDDLKAQVEVLDQGIDIPFIGTSSKKERDVFDRIRGNLEILRIEQQEEF